jgi:hypothetical protein
MPLEADTAGGQSGIQINRAFPLPWGKRGGSDTKEGQTNSTGSIKQEATGKGNEQS